jgi:hypothetical protein
MILFLEFRIMMFLALLLISFFTNALSQIIYAQNNVIDPSAFSSDPLWSTNSRIDPNCQVDIRGGSHIMYTGNFTHLNATINGGVFPQKFAWAVEPDIIKDYDDRVYDDYPVVVYSPVEPVTHMGPGDFQKRDISFYWKLEADTNRTVAVRVETEDGICEDVKTYTVLIGNTSDTQAEDFYAASKAPDHQIGPESRVLQEHIRWHTGRNPVDGTYNGEGDSFFYFHKLFLDHFNAFRVEFGYPPIVAWDPSTLLQTGSEVDFSPRNESGYSPEKLPSWFQPHPFGQDKMERPERPSYGLACEKADAPSISWPYKTQDSLNDFEPDKELLGCVLTLPYHTSIHIKVGGNRVGSISYAETAPLDPLFWRLHKFIDNVSDAHDNLVPVQFVDNLSSLSRELTTVAGLTPNEIYDNLSKLTGIDRSPPQIEFKNPQGIFPFITKIPILTQEEAESAGLGAVDEQAAISVIFNEPVTGVLANDLMVNESPATSVHGKGPGPYVFTGFIQPQIGSVNVTLSPGNIIDLNGNLFEGELWNYTLSKPTDDNDGDGIRDGLEISKYLTDPTNPDTDDDSIPDGFEVKTSCLNPLLDDSHVKNMAEEVINSTGRDFDKDGVTNVQEFKQNTSPCSP